MAMVGHTGSGKTTLAQVMAALLPPTGGKVRLWDSEWTYPRELPLELRRRIGFVFQFPEHQFFAETVFDEVAYAVRNFGLDNVEGRVRAALETVGLPFMQFKDRSPFSLSGGEKRKVALASVIVFDPDVLVLDEPSAGLDGESKVEFWNWLWRYRARGKTVVFITHWLEEAARSDKVIVLSAGHVLFYDDPVKVFSHASTMKRIGLEPPLAAEVVYELQKKGTFPWVLDLDKLLEALEEYALWP